MLHVTGTQPIKRRPRLTREQRGEPGYWYYTTLVDLGLTDEQVAAYADVHPATIRTLGGKGFGKVSARVRRAVLRHFREVAAAKGIAIDEPPAGFLAPESPAVATQPVAGLSELVALQGKLVDAFEVQAQAVMALADEIRLSRAAEVEDLLARIRVLEATQRALHPELAGLEPVEQSAPRETGG